VPKPPPDRPPKAPLPPTQRSAVTNRSRPFITPGGEQTAVGRRWRDIFEALADDRGGYDRLSEAERQLVRRCATLAVEAEIMEDERSQGKDMNLEAYIALTNSLARQLARIGLKRRARDVTPPSLESIIEGTAE